MVEDTMGAQGVVEEQDRVDVENRIRMELKNEYDSRLQEEIQKISSEMQKENERIVKDAIERFRREMAPPSEQDIQKLLDQEYMEFTIKVKGEEGKEKSFVLKELPIAVEKKIYAKVKKILIPFAEELSALSMNLLEGDAAKKIVQLMNTFDPLLDVMVSICTICLNPFEEDEEVTEEWVRKHLGSTRIVKIVSAQMEANKMRDFFSLLFRNAKLMTR